MFNRVLPEARLMVGDRDTCLPLTKNEVRFLFYNKFHRDAAAAIRFLGDRGSEERRVFGALGLDRPAIREALSELSGERPAQATLAGIVWRARFKFFDKAPPGPLGPTMCEKCNRGCKDGFEHLLGCVGLRNVPKIPTFLTDYLVELARRAIPTNPGYPTKFEEDPELSLIDYSDSSLEDISLELI